MPRGRIRHLIILGTAVLVLTAAQSPDPGPPAWIEVDPNAIQKADEPMGIEVDGIPQGLTVTLQILQDCNHDHRPDFQDQGACRSPLYSWGSAKASAGNRVHDHLSFAALEKSGISLPRNQALWLWASRPGSQQGVLALFGLLDDPCTLWQATLELFHLGSCSRSTLPQALRRHRGPLGFEGKTFEVRRLDPSGNAPPVSIAGTRGATGVAWLNAQTLLVTVAEAGSKLLCVPLHGETAILWNGPATDGLTAAAPLALPGGKIAFVRQRLPGQEAAEGRPIAVLSLWKAGRVDPAGDIPLPFRIQQLLASSTDGRQILALSLGIGENLPTFLQVDLAQHTIQNLGYDNTLYQVAFRSPLSDISVVSLEDNSGRQGWSLALVDGEGKLIRDLQARKQDDLLPVWQPNGKDLAYVAEIENKGVKQ